MAVNDEANEKMRLHNPEKEAKAFAEALVGIVKSQQNRIELLEKRNKWKSITSVPKDGTIIWLSDGSQIWLSFWREEENRWVYLMRTVIEEDITDLSFTPTHWQELPQPPEQT